LHLSRRDPKALVVLLPVAEFVEKPPVPLARALIARGALWNAFIVVARAATLQRLYLQRTPGVVGATC
jgi:mannose-1-phosphate guanylyltransferase